MSKPKFLFGSLILIVIIMLLAMSQGYFPKKLGENIEFEKIEVQIPVQYDFRGNWKLISTLKDCNEKENLNAVKVIYEIEISQKNKSKLTGKGQKIAQVVNGKLEKLAPKNVFIEGQINKEQLLVNFFEQGSNRELTGSMIFQIQNSRFEFTGQYTGAKNSCDGDVVLKRK